MDRPCGRPVRLRWVRWNGKKSKALYGSTDRDGAVLVLTINSRACSTWGLAIETLIHEYAHCRLWGMAQVEASDKIDAHGPDFWAEYGILYNMFNYLGGDRTSKRYDFG